ncbi:hypothetical protein BN133_1767 [Cronobacter dublinensis 582]|nr:hypothetical protein BN133_1767 [Cronobacter dublinensis 582]
MQADAREHHPGKGHRQHQRNGGGHHQPGAQAKRHKRNGKHNQYGLDQHPDKPAHRLAHHGGLIGDFHHLDAVRQLRRYLRHPRIQRLAKGLHIAGRRHRDSKPDGGLAVHAKLRHGRLGGLTADRRDIRQRNIAVVDMQRDGAQALFGGQRAADAKRHVVLPGAQGAGRLNGVLRLKRLADLRNIQPHTGELARGKRDNDLLLRLAQQRDFADILYGHERAAHGLHAVAQLAGRKALGGKAVNRAVSVVKLVVHGGPLRALRQRRGDILHFGAQFVPDGGHLLRRRVVAQVDVNHRTPGAGLALDVVQPRQLLEFFLQHIRYQMGGIRHRRARPQGRYHRRFDGERRIFIARQLFIAQHAGRHNQQHKKAHQLLMRQRPGGEVEFFFQ